MKQATVKLTSGEYCFLGVPDWAKEIKAYYKPLIELTMVDWLDEDENYVYPVHIPGNWQPLGADPTALTEGEAGEIVESNITYHWKNFRNYYYNGSKQSMMWTCAIARSSLDSLAASLGISKPYVVLRKNIEK